MSIHKSLATKGSLVRSRNVLSRYERIESLRKSGKWSPDEDSPFGLQKVRVLKVKKRGKEKKAKEDAAAGAAPGAAPPATGAGAPAAQAAGAKESKGAAKK